MAMNKTLGRVEGPALLAVSAAPLGRTAAKAAATQTIATRLLHFRLVMASLVEKDCEVA
jgi:hypothetical protein